MLVYNQDKIMVVSENLGDIIGDTLFSDYRKSCVFSMFFDVFYMFSQSFLEFLKQIEAN